MIVRPQRSLARVFPGLVVDLYDQISILPADTDDQRAAIDLLSLSNLNLTKVQQFFAPNLNPPEHLARLLMQHRLGLEPELKAEWIRADFFWQQLRIQVKDLSRRQELWQSLADNIVQKYPNVKVFSNPISLQQRLVDELFIDMHCGFYNGLLQAHQVSITEDSNSRELNWNDRAFSHIRYIEQLLPYSSLSQSEIQVFLSEPWQQQINLCRHAKNWTEAINLCRQRLVYCPDSNPFQDELAEIQADAIAGKLTNGQDENQQLQDAKQLQKGIQLFEDLVRDYPYNSLILDYLGNLHHLHAIRLGNSGFVAEGLVSVEKALIYAPYLQDAISTRDNLAQAMEQLNEYAEHLNVQLRQSPNAKLNAQGQRIVAQAKKGFKPREQYLRSDQATRAWKIVRTAQAVGVWRRIGGLPEPPNEAQAIALLTGLNKIFEQPPTEPEALHSTWQIVVEENPELAGLNAESICIFLEKCIWKTEESDPIITPPPQSENSFVHIDPPILRPISLESKPSREPFLPWVFSRQNLGLKAQAVIATVALLAASGLGLYDRSVRLTRQTAYEQIINANLQNNSEDVLVAAEEFLSRSPLSGKDAREGQVKELYAQAFVSWFLQQPQAMNDETVQARFKRYQSFVQKE